MVRCAIRAGLFGMVAWASVVIVGLTQANAAGPGEPTDWGRFYYYPYVYYPHNFQRPQGTFDNMYHRYSPGQQIPVYNKSWYNFYPTEKPYHSGHHFILDVF